MREMYDNTHPCIERCPGSAAFLGRDMYTPGSSREKRLPARPIFRAGRALQQTPFVIVQYELADGWRVIERGLARDLAADNTSHLVLKII